MRKTKLVINAYDLVTLYADTSKKRRERIMRKYGLSHRDAKRLYRTLCMGKWRVVSSL